MSQFEGKRPADWTPAAFEGATVDEDTGYVVLHFSRLVTQAELDLIERTLVHHLPATLTGVSPPQEG